MGKSDMPKEKIKFIRIASAIYLGTFVLSLIFSVLSNVTSATSIFFGIGNIALYGGVFFFILGFMIMGSNRGLQRRETFGQYQLRRERERPIELVSLAVSTGGILLIISGYMLLYFIS